MNLRKFFYTPIDNAPLIVFRIMFGILIAAESFGAIATGWVYNVLVKPEFTLNHIGFDWIQPLPGYGMYFYFIAMGILGILIMLGWHYRLTSLAFAIMWTGVYLMQKSAYNNHYYLLALVAFIMVLLPANRYASLDVKRNPSLKQLTMPRWVSWVMIFHIAIVYFFATLAKFYPDWLDGTFIRNLFYPKRHYPLVGFIFEKHWFYMFIAYSGIAFDGLVVPMLLWRRTRTLALLAGLFFHLFNAIFIQIGIFPFFALSYILFFYEPETIRKIFLRKKPALSDNLTELQTENKWMFQFIFIPFLIIQFLLPWRHHFIEGNVFWTEEAHRHSWRMMLRSKSGIVSFRVVDKNTGEVYPVKVHERLTKKQLKTASTKPDAMWQIAQRLKKEFAAEGKDVSVYVTAYVSLNGRPMKPLTDPSVDIAGVKWKQWSHNDWIILYDNEELFKK
jgi:vitamin K-dependent gamma-carboxylase